MPDNDPMGALDISASGLSAQRMRMNVIASNIANANSLVTPEGGPYRRREVTFSTVLKGAAAEGLPGQELGGVSVASITVSKTPPKTIYDPEHPMADKKGYVQVPDVDVTKEMVDMVSAQREYEANLSAMKAYREMVRSSLTILRQ
ncbi:MAG: flagellar basal body rod protein FlgC [Candidatus Brocadiia bacterium]